MGRDRDSSQVIVTAAALGLATRVLRGRGGLTQRALADRAELTRQAVGEVERAYVNVSLETINALCVGLGARPSELFKEAERIADLATIKK